MFASLKRLSLGLLLIAGASALLLMSDLRSRERGRVKDQNLTLKYYNAGDDRPVAQTIAREMAGGGYDLLLTIGTVSLQAAAMLNELYV